jgi:hypothetical protein
MGRDFAGSFELPSMAAVWKGAEGGSGTMGEAGSEFGGGVGVVFSPEHEATGWHVRKVWFPLRSYVDGGAVETQDAGLHRCVNVRGGFNGVRFHAINQSTYCSLTGGKSSGGGQPKPGNERAITSLRVRHARSRFQTRWVSGTPWTKTAGMVATMLVVSIRSRALA